VAWWVGAIARFVTEAAAKSSVDKTAALDALWFAKVICTVRLLDGPATILRRYCESAVVPSPLLPDGAERAPVAPSEKG
jgi:hypothetical protein